jgi:hypothetical protein
MFKDKNSCFAPIMGAKNKVIDIKLPVKREAVIA